MDKVTTVGIDLAKNSFAVHGVDEGGRTLLRKTVSRSRLLQLVVQLPPCVIGLEACSGAHEWARKFQALGHTVRIMAPRFVTPYRRRGKNDGNDAEAICEAVQRPSMRFVPIKSVEQQAVLTVHRVRQGFVEERTATVNRIRGLMSEFGVVLPGRANEVRRGAGAAAEVLPVLARRSVHELLEHLSALDERIEGYDRELASLARTSPAAKRLMTIPGVGTGCSCHGCHRWPCARVQRRSAVRGLARARPEAMEYGRQASSRPHHEARGRVLANAPDHGCTGGSADGAGSRRQGQSMGAGVEGTSRLSPRRRGTRREERSHHLGVAHASIGVPRCLNTKVNE